MTLPKKVTQRLAEKREDGAIIGICRYCHEECYANKDGILRTKLMSGSPMCLENRRHTIGRFYLSGPLRWKHSWVDTGKVAMVPAWYTEWIFEERERK